MDLNQQTYLTLITKELIKHMPHRWIRILSIWNEMERVHFIVHIKYYRSNRIQTTTSFKILNDVAVLLDPWDKIWSMKWTNIKVSKWRGYCILLPWFSRKHLFYSSLRKALKHVFFFIKTMSRGLEYCVGWASLS